MQYMLWNTMAFEIVKKMQKFRLGGQFLAILDFCIYWLFQFLRRLVLIVTRPGFISFQTHHYSRVQCLINVPGGLLIFEKFSTQDAYSFSIFFYPRWKIWFLSNLFSHWLWAFFKSFMYSNLPNKREWRNKRAWNFF